MKTFTSVLLAAATVMSVSAAQPAQLSRSLNQQQFGQISLKKAEAPTMVNGKTKLKANSLSLPADKNSLKRMAAQPMGESKVEVLYDDPFAFCSEGTEEGPYVIDLDDYNCVPEDVIGAANYGFGGFELDEAGKGVVYIPFMARVDGEDEYNLMFSPDITIPASITVTADIKIANETADTDDFYVVACNSQSGLAQDYAPISQKWETYTFNVDMSSYSGASYYLQLWAYDAADVVMKNIKITATIPPVANPVLLPATGYNGTSFTCNWEAAEGATSYLLTLVEYDMEADEITDYVFEDQEVEGTSYLVTGLDPEKVYGYFVAATDGEYTTKPVGMLVNLLTTTNNIIIDATPGQTLKAKWEPVIAANYYLAVANRTTEVAAGTNFPFADADFSGYTCGGTMDAPVESDYIYTEMPELPGWQFILGSGIDGAYGISYEYIYELFYGVTAGVESDIYDLSKVKDGTVSVSIEVASSIDCGMNVAVASYDEEVDGYVMADAALFMDEPVPSEFTKYEFTLSGCTDKSYFMIAPYPMGEDEYGFPVGNLFFKSIKINGVFASTSDTTLPLGQVEGPETEAEFATEVIDGDRYSVAVRAYNADLEAGQIYRSGDMSEYFTATAAAGIQNVSVANQGEVRYYNLQGIEVAQPENGLYIRVNGNKASKMLKK